MMIPPNKHTPAPDRPLRNKREFLRGAQARKIANKPIIHQSLMEASVYTDDSEWVALIKAAARGEFINKSLSYDGNYMYKKDKEVREAMPSDPKDLCRKFILFHKRYEGICTKDDNDNQDRRNCEMSEQDVQLTWDMCYKSMRLSRLTEYAFRTCASEKEKDELIAVLQAAYWSKMLDKNTVKMHNNVIESISVVSRNPENGKWYISG